MALSKKILSRRTKQSGVVPLVLLIYGLIASTAGAVAFDGIFQGFAGTGIIVDSITPGVAEWITTAFVFLGNFLVWLFGIGLLIVSNLFDVAIYFSVVKFNEFATMDGIKTTWTVARDLANIFFIFILLYIAIGTILQLQGIDTRRMVVKVIIIALLINFSRVLTGVVIDSGNVIAYQFYKAISTSSAGVEQSISQTFVGALQVQSPLAATRELGSSPEAVSESDGLNLSQVILHSLGAIILILVTSFVLAAGAILLIIRIVILIFVIVLSPLAFLAYAFPKQEHLFDDWLKQLFNQTFFAPAYLFMIYLVAKIINSTNLTNAASGAEESSASVKTVGVIINFIILIGLMLGSIIIAKKMGAYGAKTVDGWQKNLTGRAKGVARWTGRKTVGAAVRNTVGTGGRAMAEGGVLKNFEKGGKVPNLARGLRNLGKRGQDVDFGLKGASLNDFAQAKLSGANLDDYKGDAEAQAQILRNLNPQARLAHYRKISADERAKLEASTINDPKLEAIFKTMREGLPNTKEQRDTNKALEIAKVEKSVKDGLKLIKEKGLIPSLDDKGKVMRDSSGNIIGVTETDPAKRAEQMRRFTKLIKPSKDSAGDLADALKFKGTDEEQTVSKMLIQSLSNNQLNNLLRPESIDAMKDSDGILDGIKGSINELSDDNPLKEYVRNTAAFSSLLGIKKSKGAVEIQQHLNVLRKSREEMEQEVANDPELVEINRKITMHAGSDYQLPIDRDNLINKLVLNKQKEALQELSKSPKGAPELAPFLSGSPADIEKTEFILKNLSTAKVQAIEKSFTAVQREQLNTHYKADKVMERDPALAKQLDALGVEYEGHPEKVAPTAAGGGGGTPISLLVPVGGNGGGGNPTQGSAAGFSAPRVPRGPDVIPSSPRQAPPLTQSQASTQKRVTPYNPPRISDEERVNIVPSSASAARMEVALEGGANISKPIQNVAPERVAAAQQALETGIKEKQGGEIKTQEKSVVVSGEKIVPTLAKMLPSVYSDPNKRAQRLSEIMESFEKIKAQSKKDNPGLKEDEHETIAIKNLDSVMTDDEKSALTKL